jgi:glycosyltransferase involved in cell wall biosynthesis
MPTDISDLRVAIIHDWLVTSRGGERVLEALCEIFPQSEIFTLFHKPGSTTERIESRPIHASFLNRLPKVEKYYRNLLPLLPYTIEQTQLEGFDLILSSSHCVAKGVIPPPGTLHISYLHTTMRYAWDQAYQYFGGGLKEFLVSPFLHYLRMWDVTSSARVDHFIANSRFVSQRIEKYYRRPSDVVNPFVDLERFKPAHGEKGDYYLLVSAFAPYKRVDLAIEACEKLGKRLLIVGGGQQEKTLKRMGGKWTQFLGNLPDDFLPDLFAGAKALLFPGVEDFGITPLEAMASGTPVIALGAGGALETIEEGKTGLFFYEQTAEALIQAIQTFEKQPNTFTAAACRERAEFFSKSRFQKQILGIVAQQLENRTGFRRRTPGPGLYLDA